METSVAHAGKCLNVTVFEDKLVEFGFRDRHPEAFAYVVGGVKNGFDIAVDGTPSSSHRNMAVSMEDKIDITAWLSDCIQRDDLHAVAGPFDTDSPAKVDGRIITAPLGAVRKPSGKVRPIHNISAPYERGSVNSLIANANKRTSYTSTLELIRLVIAVGLGGFLWSADLLDAYLKIPVRRADCHLLGVQWLGKFMVFTSLCFGLASAPRIYTVFADAVEYLIHNSEPDLFESEWDGALVQMVRHFLDNFFGGHHNLQLAQRQFNAVLGWFRLLGITTRPEKCNQPATRQVILGLEFDTVSQTVRIPTKKVDKLLGLVAKALRRRRIKRKDLMSLIGLLRWASAAVWTGNAFVRPLGWALTRAGQRAKHITLRASVEKMDLEWWRQAIHSTAHVMSLRWLAKPHDANDIQLWTDASGSVGLGGFTSAGHWFQCRWHEVAGYYVAPSACRGIYWGELCAIATAVELFGAGWRGQAVSFLCDNQNTVAALARKYCSAERHDIMALIRRICAASLKYEFYFWIDYIESDANSIADALSRYKPYPLLQHQADVPLDMHFDGSATACADAVSACLDGSVEAIRRAQHIM